MIDNLSGEALTGVLEQVLHHHFTHALQGLLPSTINGHKLKKVLDLNCRIGAWAIDVALSYPGVFVTGLDNRSHFIDIARHNAQIGGLDRASFYEADISQTLAFTDDTFDLLHLSMSSIIFRPDQWPLFLQECARIMKPGATINLINISAGPSSSEAFQQLAILIDQLLQRLHYSFSDHAGTSSPGVYFCQLLRSMGFKDVSYIIRPINFGGWNNFSGRACCQVILDDLKRVKPYFLANKITTDEEFDAIIEQQRKDIADVNFCGTGAVISTIGKKP